MTIYERTRGRGDRPGPRALHGRHPARGIGAARDRGLHRAAARRAPPLHAALLADGRDRAAAARRSGRSIGWAGRETISDLRHLFFYAQRTPDDRIAIGGRGAPYRLGSPIDESYERNDGVRARLVRTIAERFPAAARAAITHHWGGPLGVPRDWCCSVHYDPATRLRLGRRLHRPRRRHEQRARPHARRPRAAARHGPRLAAVGRAREPALGARAAALPRLARDRRHARQRRPLRGRDATARPGARGSCGRSCRLAESAREPFPGALRRRSVDGLPIAALACR